METMDGQGKEQDGVSKGIYGLRTNILKADRLFC